MARYLLLPLPLHACSFTERLGMRLSPDAMEESNHMPELQC